MTAKEQKTVANWIFARLRDFQEQAEKVGSPLHTGFRVTAFYGSDGKIKLTYSPSKGQTFIGVPWSGTALRATADMLEARAALGRQGTAANLARYNKANAKMMKVVEEDGPITERHREPVPPKDEIVRLQNEAYEADKKWIALYEAKFPKRFSGKVRYSLDAEGTPGSALRVAYDRFVAASEAAHKAREQSWGPLPKPNPLRKGYLADPLAKARRRALAAGQPKENPLPRGPRGDVDEQGARELHLTIVNEGELYNQRRSIEQNLDRKRAKGVYQKDLAVKLWRYWVDNGAKLYDKQYDVKFNVPTRNRAAEMMEEEDEQRFRDDGSSVKVKAKPRKNPLPPEYKSGASRGYGGDPKRGAAMGRTPLPSNSTSTALVVRPKRAKQNPTAPKKTRRSATHRNQTELIYAANGA